MKKALFLLPIVFVIWGFTAPKDIWEILAQIKFKIYFDEKLEESIWEPVPTESIKNLDGKIIEIKGFVLTNGRTQELWKFIPEHYEYRSIEGIETIIKIISKNKIIIAHGKPCTLKGRFELNTKDLLDLPYFLHDVECLDCKE